MPTKRATETDAPRPRKRAAKRITSTMLEALKPGRDAGEVVLDRGERGKGSLVLRVTATAKPVYFRYYVGGERRFELLGYFDPRGAQRWREDDGTTNRGNPCSLAALREGFAEFVQLAGRFGDLKAHFAAEDARTRAAEQAAKVAAERERMTGTFGELLDAYVAALRAAGKVSASAVEQCFERNVRRRFPELLARRAQEIEPEDVQAILAKVIQGGDARRVRGNPDKRGPARKGATRDVNVTRAYLLAAFNHAIEGHDLDPRRLAQDKKLYRVKVNPAASVPRIAEWDRIGERTLTRAELAAYWRGLEKVAHPAAKAFLKFHTLTACQRPAQVLREPWESFDLRANVLTVTDPKGRALRRQHLVPLHARALAELDAAKAANAELPEARKGHAIRLPFTTNGRTPLRLETVAAEVRAISRAMVAEAQARGEDVQPFTLRDVRRTCETALAECRISQEIRAQLLSHGRGDRIAATYNKHAYLDEKRHALEVWIDYLDGCLEGEATPANVIPLRRA
jgi:integrase